MTIRSRLLLSFSTIVLFLLGFGIYQNSVYGSISAVNFSTEYISKINIEIQSIKTAQFNLMRTNDRSHITKIFDQISLIRSDTEKISTIGLDKETLGTLANVQQLFDEYEVLFKQFISTNDQYYALSSEVSENTSDLLLLIENAIVHYNLDQYINSQDLIVDLISLINNAQCDTETIEDHIKTLLIISEQLKDKSFPFEIQLIGQRLKTTYSNYADNVQILNELKTLNMEVSSKLDAKIQLLSDLMDDVFYSQAFYSQIVLRQLRLTYIITFIIILLTVVIVLYTLNHRINTSFKNLIKGTDLISKGEYTIDLNLTGNDEFNDLAKSINRMANELKMADFSIKTYSSQLENMVAAKTLELTRAKEELETVNTIIQEERNRFAELAMTDVLTGLKNRAFFIEFLSQKIQEAMRYHKPFSMMIVDIDFFKSVNDRYGHQVGDGVLKIIADILLHESRSSDLVARYGGEEFMLVFPESSLENALIISERIRITVESKVFIQEGLNLTISGGLAEYRGTSEDEFLKLVDDLLYQAKAGGRNRIETVLHKK